MASTQVQARISPELKAESFKILDEMGLSFSDYIRLNLKQLTRDRSIQFRIELESIYQNDERTVIENESHLRALLDIP